MTITSRARLLLVFVAAVLLSVHGQQESNVRCCLGDENRPFALDCPPGTTIAQVTTASYGNPSGYCGQWTLGSCHTDVHNVIEAQCVGRSHCEFVPSDSFFGVPDICPEGSKRLAVQWQCGGTVNRTTVILPAIPPLSTRGRYIVDATGSRVKLAGVNWYGAQCQEYVPDGLHVNHVRDISRNIREAGFNVVRLQWSNEIVAKNPLVEEMYVAANPQMKGLRALDVYTAVVQALEQEGVFVIIDNHMSDADWCCNIDDQNGLWYNSRYSEEVFFQHWEYMVQRYINFANVIGAELRNELRFSCGNVDENGDRLCRSPTWDGPEAINWKRASTTAGNRIHKVNPNLLVFISGLASSSRLRFVRESSASLEVPNKLVYVSHDYPWWHPDVIPDYNGYKEDVENNWGFVVQENQNWTAPLFVSEFGTCHDSMSCLEDTGSVLPGMTGGRWFQFLTTYLKEIDVDFSTWAWNGSTCKGDGRNYGTEEGYGIANICWNGIAYQPMLESPQELQKPVVVF